MTRIRRRLNALAAPALALSLVTCDSATGPNAALVDFLLGFCDLDLPTWVAYQNTGGAWTRVTLGANGSATIKVTPKFAVATAFAYPEINFYETSVFYATTAEMAPVASTPSCFDDFGTKTVNGSISALTSGQTAQVSLGGSSDFLYQGGPTSFTLFGVADGALDLLAVRETNFVPDRVIIRRALNQADGSTVPILNFGASEALAVATATLTFSGHGASDFIEADVDFTTANGSTYFFSLPTAGSSSVALRGMPASLTQSGDLHMIELGARPSATPASRGVIAFSRNITDQSLAFGPSVGTPTITSSGSSPVLMRAQLASQSEYGSFIQVMFDQSNNDVIRQVSVMATKGYYGSTPATWDIETPNLSGVAGYPAGASLTAGGVTDWILAVSDASVGNAIGSNGADGTTIRYALRGSSGSVLSGAEADGGARAPTARGLMRFGKVRR